MFLNPSDFPEYKDLERRFPEIKAEFKKIYSEQDDFIKWRAKDIGHYNWFIIGFKFCNRIFKNNIELFPILSEVMGGFKGTTLATFSRLKGKTKINPHHGYDDNTYRGYMGIKVPPGCTLTVGGETRAVEEGKLLFFDDTVEHFASNESEDERIVFLFDIPVPGKKYVQTPNNRITEGLVRFHGRLWDLRHIRRKLIHLVDNICKVEGGPSAYKDHWTLVADCGADSLDVLEIGMAIEEEIAEREISDEDINTLARLSLKRACEWLWIDKRKRKVSL